MKRSPVRGAVKAGAGFRLLILTCLALLVACGGGDRQAANDGAGSVEVSRDPILLPADARAIVDDLHAGSDKANASLDRSLQDSIETSPAREIDDAVFAQLKAAGKASSPGPGAIREASTYVPRQTSYPGYFLAFVKTAPSGPGLPANSWLWLYEKSEEDEPWKFAMYVALPPDYAAPDIVVDADGFAEMVSKENGEALKLAPSRLPRELAGYLSGFETGPESSIFAPGTHTTQYAQSVKALTERQSTQQITTSVEVEAGEFPVQAFRTRDGGALAMFSLKVATTYAAAPGQTLRPTRGSEGLLEQGEYASIQHNAVNMVAAVVPPEGPDAQVQIVASAGGTVSFETTQP